MQRSNTLHLLNQRMHSKIGLTYSILATATLFILSLSFLTPTLAANPMSNPGNPVACGASPAPGGHSRTLTCSGKISGLGNVESVTAQLTADVTTDCTDKPGHKTPGHTHLIGTPQSLPVNNGQITFTLPVTVSANCPPSQIGSVSTFSNVAILIDNTIIQIPGGPF
jgi:hypothetical protein